MSLTRRFSALCLTVLAAVLLFSRRPFTSRPGSISIARFENAFYGAGGSGGGGRDSSQRRRVGARGARTSARPGNPALIACAGSSLTTAAGESIIRGIGLKRSSPETRRSNFKVGNDIQGCRSFQENLARLPPSRPARHAAGVRFWGSSTSICAPVSLRRARYSYPYLVIVVHAPLDPSKAMLGSLAAFLVAVSVGSWLVAALFCRRLSGDPGPAHSDGRVGKRPRCRRPRLARGGAGYRR